MELCHLSMEELEFYDRLWGQAASEAGEGEPTFFGLRGHHLWAEGVIGVIPPFKISAAEYGDLMLLHKDLNCALERPEEEHHLVLGDEDTSCASSSQCLEEL
ncbi:hypothetical protein AV530_007763 [Patagioenas fasciata monilis]|uniref:Uncharacterized protein n=1 Tax=Patagioenas fasciata monilis TaxID=372326 RepID=A0A1V4JZ87_PATFA|nr:hypothetical protein AV530_007763 [Patagioenas fasciata monilis]